MLFKLLNIPSWAKGFLAATGIAGGAATIDIASSAPVLAECSSAYRYFTNR